jgi:mono/diheme cytochrome c family protein
MLRIRSCLPKRATPLLIGLAFAICGCDEQSMVQQKRYDPYEPSTLWRNGSEAQPLPDGVVVQGDAQQMRESELPPPVDKRLLDRGHQRFDIFCAPCHGPSGAGDGIIVRRGFPAPPSLHTARLLSAPANHFFDVMTRGYGAMYSYAARVDPHDRWAIVVYIRALQTARHVRLADVPDAKDRLP